VTLLPCGVPLLGVALQTRIPPHSIYHPRPNHMHAHKTNIRRLSQREIDNILESLNQQPSATNGGEEVDGDEGGGSGGGRGYMDFDQFLRIMHGRLENMFDERQMEKCFDMFTQANPTRSIIQGATSQASAKGGALNAGRGLIMAHHPGAAAPAAKKPVDTRTMINAEDTSCFWRTNATSP
jgi:hypothetical protein